MKILIVGGGAREHAIAYKLVQNPKVEKLYAAPGNGGLAQLAELVPIKVNEINKLADFAEQKKIDLTIVGPEEPLCLGIVDQFNQRGLAVFGPTKEPARLEGSKSFAKEFMLRNGIPTGAYFRTEDPEEAREIYKRLLETSPYEKAVIKADGLCAGKGVLVGETLEEGYHFIDRIQNGDLCGESFAVVVEEYLEGIEASLLCFVDQSTILPMPTAKDHKRILEAERGANTGGMGTYSPNPIAEAYLQEMMTEIALPFHQGLQRESLSYRGIIFFGVMITEFGVKVLEFNVRFGDPEAQSILMRLDSDLLDILTHAMADRLSDFGKLAWSKEQAVTLVLTSGGYPADYTTGKQIHGLEKTQTLDKIAIFHGGTKLEGDNIVTAGGRVLSLTARAATTDEAMKAVYDLAEKINFEGKTYRKDIGPMVKRVYVSKRSPYDLEAKEIHDEINDSLGIQVEGVHLYQRYDIQGLTRGELDAIADTILREPMVDDIYIQEEAFYKEKEFQNPVVLSLQKGQYDQREDGLLQSIALTLGKEDIKIRVSQVYDIRGKVVSGKLEEIKSYLINPVDQEQGSIKLPNLLEEEAEIIHTVPVAEGFIGMNAEELKQYYENRQPAMSLADLTYVQEYFREQEKRNPTEIELSMIDTYWSDHCRHTTFLTTLSEIDFTGNEKNTPLTRLLQDTYQDYLSLRKATGRDEKDINLMDLATIMSRYMRVQGELDDLEVSDEINACSIKIPVTIDKDGIAQEQDYLLMFKNETHNHPTEIEPFGGASTCLGGAIRDPLSGRAYVYQAMRLTGSADPREPLADTLPGKLPQKKITTKAAAGYSAYGNQIGLCTGYVDEVYHEGFKAKRMEVGAVIGAAPQENIRRQKPSPGDVILLIGGRTGRDGVGGATGSSKEHTEKSIDRSSAEVQKGNAPSERKLLRLFRRKEAAILIKKCNDFGAGGVSVAIGELADGLHIWLDKVPLKYRGLTPGEIAISESQERMACVLNPADVDEFMEYCHQENIEATVVATVTQQPRLRMTFGSDTVVDISRAFLDSSGVTPVQKVRAEFPVLPDMLAGSPINHIEDALMNRLSDLNVCSKKGLIEKFDNTIGAGSVLVPLGGKRQLTPAQGMVAVVPAMEGVSQTVSLMSCGYHPDLSSQSPFHGAYYAVIESTAKIAAMGGDIARVRLSFQEYFEKLGTDPSKWGKPLTALLGALKAQRQLNIPAIGGKDSMSGTFKELNVPPTLISFAVTTAKIDAITSPELKRTDSRVGLLYTPMLEDGTLDIVVYQENLKTLQKLRNDEVLLSAYAVTGEGILPGLVKMALGNSIGLVLEELDFAMIMKPAYGSFLVELSRVADDRQVSAVIPLGQTTTDNSLTLGSGKPMAMELLCQAYENPLEEIFPVKNKIYEGDWLDIGSTIKEEKAVTTVSGTSRSGTGLAKPKVLISVFPGTNCEYDSAMAFERAGAKATIQVFRNRTLQDIEESAIALERELSTSQIFMIPGGFSLADEPDGSGKFIAAVLRNPRVQEALQRLLEERDGLILGICNGFQALIKTGLLPYGKIRALDEQSPTLTHNQCGRHVAQFVKTKVISTTSPWTNLLREGDIQDIPVSHGEGRFVAPQAVIDHLYAEGQVAFQYVTPDGQPALHRPYNPNGSMGSIEGLLSPCGRILGKMGHSERVRQGIYKNYPHTGRQLLFESGVGYYK